MEGVEGWIYVVKGAVMPGRRDKKVSEPDMKSPMFQKHAFNLHPPLTSSRDCLSPAEIPQLPSGLSSVLLNAGEAMLKFATNRE